MKSLAIIGSTGSIGKTSLKIYKDNDKKFKLIYLAAYTNLKKLLRQHKAYRPKNIFLLNQNKKINNNKLISKEFALREKQKKIDYIISGVSSYEALNINLKLIKICKNLLIANKETIICGGKFLLSYAKKYNCNIIPIDSEHYCVNYLLKKIRNKNEIKKIHLCASGGPFFNKKIKSNENIKNVLNHPTWKMGKKISIDSSTFANKIMELFEAKILFNLSNKIIGKIIVEQSSKIHAIIKLKNNLILPVLHVPNMELSISNSLSLENNLNTNLNKLNLSFKIPCFKKFPIVKLGYELLNNYDHVAMILFTVINERLVLKYLKGEIKYGDIVKILVRTFKNKKTINLLKLKIKKIKDVYKIIKIGKELKL